MDVYRELDAFAPFSDDYLLSEDIWKQFQIEEMQFPALPTVDLTCSTLCQQNCKVENDCMWNGHYGRDVMCKSTTTPAAPPGVKQQPPVGQVSLLKPALRMGVDPNTVLPMATPAAHFIQTPPISDDEDAKPMTTTLETLQSAIIESYIDGDDDLDDYFKGEDADFSVFDDEVDEDEDDDEEEEEVKYADQLRCIVKEEIEEEEPHVQFSSPYAYHHIKQEVVEEEQQDKYAQQMRAFYAAESDHSYHKGNHGAMHSLSLGIDTPSDSEEEIDVVSLGEKFGANKTALPTNPSTKDRRQLQRTMQSRFPQGIKTIMPVKRPPAAHHQTKSKPPGRPRQYKKVNQNHRQYKRRCVYGHSSDSEPETSEKRSLHNNMERQRRIDLRNLFNDLKKLVPEVNKKQRAAKVLILRAAAQYCRDLTNQDEGLQRRVELLKKQQARYRNELSKLRRDFAAKR